MTLAAAAFAIPGDLDTRTGGYNYERSLLYALRAAGRAVEHIRTGDSFPHPTRGDEAETLRRLQELPGDVPLILDGLIFGAVDTEGLAAIRAPVVAMLHHPLGLEAGLPPERARALLERERDNLRHAAHVVVPSPHTKRILVADFGVAEADISVALPGFDRPELQGLAPAVPPLILSVGIICARKGHDVLLAALARLADLDWRAEIVGMTHDPEVEAALRAQRAALGLEARVGLPGCIPDAALSALFEQATVFALATRYEGYGLVFSEAQLHGLPVVTCAVGAVPETVPPGAGALVPADDPEAFAAALRVMLTEPDRRAACARVARAAGARLPHWSDTAGVMGAVLDRLAGAG
ncbi:MAG: glycosyltransferase family 4 protein [Rhodobacteraceae bacterium]|nr:glycosyltransferase family 4 protein [Paracoccaceae bacterium]